MTEQLREYLFLTARVSPAAVGVHAQAAAIAALGRTGDLVPRTELAALRGWDDDVERELLDIQLLEATTIDSLRVLVWPVNLESVRAYGKRARDRQRSRESRDSVARSRESRDEPVAVARARTAAAAPPLLNRLEGGRSAAAVVAGARDAALVEQLGGLLAQVFCRAGDVLTDEAIAAGIAAARAEGVDPVAAAVEVIAVEQKEGWRRRHVATAMRVAAHRMVHPVRPGAQAPAADSRRAMVERGELSLHEYFAAEASA